MCNIVQSDDCIQLKHAGEQTLLTVRDSVDVTETVYVTVHWWNTSGTSVNAYVFWP